MNKKEELLESIKELPLVKRIHELESYIDNNKRINELFKNLKEVSKQMVISKHIGHFENYKIYKEEYDEIKKECISYPFVEEYLDLLDEANELVKEISFIIEKDINEEIE